MKWGEGWGGVRESWAVGDGWSGRACEFTTTVIQFHPTLPCFHPAAS